MRPHAVPVTSAPLKEKGRVSLRVPRHPSASSLAASSRMLAGATPGALRTLNKLLFYLPEVLIISVAGLSSLGPPAVSGCCSTFFIISTHILNLMLNKDKGVLCSSSSLCRALFCLFDGNSSYTLILIERLCDSVMIPSGHMTSVLLSILERGPPLFSPQGFSPFFSLKGFFLFLVSCS